MVAELKREGVLYQDAVVSEIVNRFGEEFVYWNENDNQVTDKRVLKEFNRLTPDVVWDRGSRYWRLREPYDDPGRQQ